MNRGASDKRLGRVILCGVGPGRLDWLTIAALRWIESADVLAFDELVPDAIVELGRSDAERIRVGRRGYGVRHHEASIHPAVIERAKAGALVVRLKGGDPSIFGRSSEELGELRRHGIEAEVVPGITAASGAAARLGISLTERGRARELRLTTAKLAGGTPFVTGAEPGATLVVYMGLRALGSYARTLVDRGFSRATPACVISAVGRPEERVVSATLGTIAQRVRLARITSPALVIVGDVVQEAEVATAAREPGAHDSLSAVG